MFDEGRTRPLGTTTANDVKTLAGTGKGHIEQIEIVDSGLEVLLQVVSFVDGAHHVFLTVVDGGDGQIAEGLYGGAAPEHVARMFQGPVAEGTDDVGELQALGFVDGDQTDAISLVALDGLAVEVLVPLVEERVDIAGVVADKVGELVVEGAYIGALTFDLAQAEDGVEACAEVVARGSERRAGKASI